MTHGLSRPCSAIISCACSTLTRGVRFGSSGSAVIVMVSHDSPAFVHDSYSSPVVLVGLPAWRISASCGLPVKICCAARSEEHTSELQSLMRISYAVFCLKKKKMYGMYQIQLYHNSSTNIHAS